MTTTIMKARVVIIGAGASGLQCAQTLIQEKVCQLHDIIILEARDRIGGRIHSTNEVRTDINGNKCQFYMDHGAAWVHGIGIEWNESMEQYNVKSKPFPNPMMELLHQDTLSTNIGSVLNSNNSNKITNNNNETVFTKHLHNTVSGNPWIRPNTILHRTNEIQLYVDGDIIDNQSILVKHAIKRHYKILQKVNDIGKQKDDKDITEMNLQEMILQIENNNDSLNELLSKEFITLSKHDQEMILSITPFYLHLIECWYGASISDISLHDFVDSSDDNESDDDDNEDDEWNDTNYEPDGDFYGSHCTVKTGMKSVLNPLLQNGITDRIMLNEEVTNISRVDDILDVNDRNTTSPLSSTSGPSSSNVRVKTKGGQTILAECCVVTIPPGCIQANMDQLFPSTKLSNEKIMAIQYMKMGTYKKVLFTFNKIFWPKNPTFIGLIKKQQKKDDTDTNNNKNDNSSPLGNFLLCDNLWARNNIPCIEAVLFGVSGEWASYKSDDIIKETVLTFLFNALGADRDDQYQCIDCHITRWEEDPYSLGSYSAMKVGATKQHMLDYNKPEWDNTLIFSGEATIEDYEGCVHSALLSGTNAAQKVITKLLLSK